MSTNHTQTATDSVNLGPSELSQGNPLTASPSANQSIGRTPGRQELRQRRLDDLLASCREQVLQQVIGPFGLTPSMFDDKMGGNVTTQHNADKDIFAKESERFNRSDYDYTAAKKEKMREAVKDGSMTSQTFVDAYTGREEPTKRLNGSGKIVMNAEVDHTIPVKQAHRMGGWMKDEAGRTEIASEKANLNYTTHKTNRKKGAKPPEEVLSAENGFDETHVNPIVETAREAIDAHLPTTKERAVYHGKELLMTGATEAGKNALRQAMGVLMFEFVNGSYQEISTIIKEPVPEHSLIDRIIAGLKRVLERVRNKLSAAFDALLSGGAQGFISNLLTFVINTVITTSAKVVTIIRESLQGIWAAVKMVLSPPPGASSMDVARAATKLIAGVVTTSLGMLFEQSVKAFIVSIPLLVPLADTVAPVVTGILTGLMTALTIYGIDRLFDWLSSKGTEFLEAQLGKLDADSEMVNHIAGLLDQQYRQSRLYEDIATENRAIFAKYDHSERQFADARDHASATHETRARLMDSLAKADNAMREMDDELEELLNQYQLD